MDKILSSADVIAQSGVTFGTSGARGLVTQFTANVCAAFSAAFVQSMQRNHEFTQVAIAIDNRPSSYGMAQACAAALANFNIGVLYYGVIPTPALAYKAMQDNMPAIMVTGSHIPFDRNGLKFYRPDGEISKVDEKAIVNNDIMFKAVESLSELNVSCDAANGYIARYTSLLPKSLLANKRIGIYEHSSAGRDLYYKIFEALGAEVIALERSDVFVPIDTEAVSEQDVLKAIAWSEKYNLDVIFSTDGDGDRPLVSDENGNWLRGDILGLLCADTLNIEALAIPVSCNTAIESCNKFKHISRTKIGSPYVIAEFAQLAKKYERIAGFEANGGFLLGSDIQLNNKLLKSLPTRDAILPAIMLLVAAKKSTISELVNALPARFTFSDRIQNFAIEKSQAIISLGKNTPSLLMAKLGFENITIDTVDEKDGLRITFENGNIIHLRPSGNSPELRCYGEANNFSTANKIVLSTLSKVKSLDIN